MAYVTARNDIWTTNELCIAHKGTKGRAVRGQRPHEDTNYGKVLVYFGRRQKGYWCAPEDLEFPKKSNLSDYVATKAQHDPYQDALSLPFDNKVTEYDFGKNLRICRQARRFSQAKLGEAMGRFLGTAKKPLAQSTICYRERCRHSPGGQFVTAAAKALNVPAMVFFVDLNDSEIFGKTKDFLHSLSSAVFQN